jgi:hypothetical protein
MPMMPEPKPPDNKFDNWLDWCIAVHPWTDMRENCATELAALRADAEKWRKACRSEKDKRRARSHFPKDDDHADDDGPPDIHSPTYKQEMEEWIKHHAK